MEELREKLIRSIEEKGYTHEETVRLSQELDKYIVKATLNQLGVACKKGICAI